MLQQSNNIFFEPHACSFGLIYHIYSINYAIMSHDPIETEIVSMGKLSLNRHGNCMRKVCRVDDAFCKED